ncbi:MAG: hypothetical protein ACYC5M_13145 [Anaerolineae bacterium]
MRRFRFYERAGVITSLLLLAVMWLGMLTGLGSIKGRAYAAVTLGLLDPAQAGKLHTIWLPLMAGVLLYAHVVFSLQRLLRRQRWVRHRLAWEVGIFVLGALLLGQYLILYYA